MVQLVETTIREFPDEVSMKRYLKLWRRSSPVDRKFFHELKTEKVAYFSAEEHLVDNKITEVRIIEIPDESRIIRPGLQIIK